MLDEEKLVELLVRRDDLLEQGHDATPEEVCAECPELLEEYKARLESLKRTEFLFETDDGEDDESFTSPGSATVAINGPDLPSSSLTIEQFLRAIAESGLMTEEEVESFQQTVSTEVSSDTPSLARELVQRQKLTLYQASVLLAERSDPLLLDRYIILDTIDSGGMGLVFKALHRSLDRVVALKTLPPSAVDSEEKVKRFQREAKTAAKLSHPNIVTTYDAHESNGIHFLVMEYVKGKDLRKVVNAQGPLPVATAVNYLLQAARGLEHAHAQGIIHRDIKPGNLLLDADGTVKVLDLGLARLETLNGATETEEDLTAVGGVMGTAAYMSPEQAVDTHDANARSDIYSLGCTLYFLITGKPPYKENTLVNTILAHRDKPIPALSEERDDVPEELIVVYRRMMAKKPEDRFQTMTEVIAALSQCEVARTEPVATGGPANAVEETIAYQTKPQSRKWLWTLGAVATLLMAAIIVLGVVFKINTPVGTLVVEVNEPDAVVQIDGGKVQITTPNDGQPVEIEVDEGRHTLKVSKGGFETHTKEIAIKAGDKEVVAVRLVPIAQPSEPRQAQSQQTAEAKHPPMPSATRTDKEVDRPPTIRMVRSFRLGKEREPGILGLDLLDAQMSAIILSWAVAIQVDLNSGVARQLFSNTVGQGVFKRMALSPDRRYLAVGNADGLLQMRNLANESLLWEVHGHQSSVTAIGFSSDGSRIVSGSLDKHVRVWDAATGQELAESSLGVHCYIAAFMPDDVGTILGGPVGWLELWDIQSNQRLKKFPTIITAGNVMAGPVFVNDGREMLTGDTGETPSLFLWDLSSGKVLRTYIGHTGDVSSLRLLPDGRHFISGSADGTLRIWSLDHDRERYRGEAPTALTEHVAVTPDGKFAVTGGRTPETATKSLFVWELPDLSDDVKDAKQEPSATQPDPTEKQPPPLAIAPFTPEEAKQHQQAWADHLGVPVEFENSIGMKMVLIPPGEFMMGSSEEEIEALLQEAQEKEDGEWLDYIRAEGPQHKIRLTRPFYLAAYELTVGEFREFVEATGVKTAAETRSGGGVGWVKDAKDWPWVSKPEFNWDNVGYEQSDQHPVTNVSWHDAEAFCQWLGKQENGIYRLPSEAQWEYSCRAGSTTRWSFGDNVEDLDRYVRSKADMPTPVGLTLPNGFGVFDMHGNLREWCLDWYGADYYNRSPQDNPKGPQSGEYRVLRGGSNVVQRILCRSATRRSFIPTNGGIGQGFRPILLIDAKPKPSHFREDLPSGPNSPPTTSSAQNGVIVKLPDTADQADDGMTASEKTQAQIEREIAEWVLSRGGHVNVQTTGSEILEVFDAQELPNPDVSFSVVRVDFTDIQGLEKSDIDRLFKIHKLRALQLNSAQLPQQAVESLAKIEGLAELSVLGTHFPVEVFDLLLANNPDLTHLNIMYTDITEKRVAEVAKLKNLKVLWISNIGDDELRVLAEHGDLQFLRAGGSDITDAGIAVLENMKSLSELRLGQTSVTTKGIERLENALPQCKINCLEEMVEPDGER